VSTLPSPGLSRSCLGRNTAGGTNYGETLSRLSEGQERRGVSDRALFSEPAGLKLKGHEVIGRVGGLESLGGAEGESKASVIVRLADQENCPPVRSVETGEGFEDQD